MGLNIRYDKHKTRIVCRDGSGNFGTGFFSFHRVIKVGASWNWTIFGNGRDRARNTALMDCPSIWSKCCRAGDGGIYCLMEAEVVPCNRTANLGWHILYHWYPDSGIVPFRHGHSGSHPRDDIRVCDTWSWHNKGCKNGKNRPANFKVRQTIED